MTNVIRVLIISTYKMKGPPIMIQSDDQKFQVLLTELNERYNASHKIRERSYNFTLWISGMGIGLGWLLISQGPLSFFQRIALTILILTLYVGAFYFILGLRRGFQKNRDAMIRIENTLMMYEKGVYLPGRSLLPMEYSQTKRKWSDHFCALCFWLALVTLSLFILNWTGPDQHQISTSNQTFEMVEGEQQNGRPLQ